MLGESDEVVTAATTGQSATPGTEEIARLRQRVMDLEFVVAEYQSQHTQLMHSVSWRATRPLRAGARLLRTTQDRARRARARNRSRRTSDKLLLTGLIPSGKGFSRPLTSRAASSSDTGLLSADAPLNRRSASIVVLAHVHYPELWPDISDRFARIPMKFDLVVTVTEGTAESVIPGIKRHHPEAKIVVVSNRGRDWGPTLEVVRAGLVSGYDAVVKVHTKKSEHRVDGSGWRLELLDAVLASPAHVRQIVALLASDETVGIVAPHRHIAGPESWGSDRDIVLRLAETLPMPVAEDDLQFPAGSMFWCRPWLLERLTDFDLSAVPFDVEGGQLDGTTAHAFERMVGVVCHAAGMEVIDTASVNRRLRSVSSRKHAPRVLSFYYPQFHQISENDRFWGEGFTDWDNVQKARPLFDGHRQPFLPHSSVDQYDLSDPSVIRLQVATARQHGIDGFVFHYYWFSGHKVLDSPLRNLLADASIDMPFALSWANESWTRRWDGLDEDVLIQQTYPEGWEERFFRDVGPMMSDPRYITVQGLPLLMVYRIGEIPQAASAIRIWKALAAEAGLGGLHVIAVNPSRHQRPLTADVLSELDGICAFPPGDGINTVSIKKHITPFANALRGDVYAYDLAFDFSAPYSGPVPHHPTVFPGWDNTARRGENAYIFHGSNPATWRKHFSSAMKRAAHDETIVFINAWNEWAEGACLEPSDRFGSAFLRTLHEIKTLQARSRSAARDVPDGPTRPAQSQLSVSSQL